MTDRDTLARDSVILCSAANPQNYIKCTGEHNGERVVHQYDVYRDGVQQQAADRFGTGGIFTDEHSKGADGKAVRVTLENGKSTSYWNALKQDMMEKSGILIMILSTLFVLYERRKIRIRTIGLTFGIIIVLFFFFNMSKEDANSDESMSFMDFFGMYITSPMIAFERLKVTIGDTFAANTLNDFYPQLMRFGIKIDGIQRLQDFVYVPIPTNVYTIMQPFYNDFGRMGVAFFGFLYGSLFGFVYRKFYDGDDMYKCFYTYLVEVIIIQFYNENLLQIFHLVIEASFIIILLTKLGKFSFSSLSVNTT